MKTDVFNKKITLKIASLENSPLKEFKEKNMKDVPLSVLAGKLVKEARETGGTSVELDEASYNFIGNWMATAEPKEVLLAHTAFEMDKLKDFDISIDDFVGRILASLDTAFVSTVAENYGIDVDLVKHANEYLNAISQNIDSEIKL